MTFFCHFSCLWFKSVASSFGEEYRFYKLASTLILEHITRQIFYYALMSHFASRYATLSKKRFEIASEKCCENVTTIVEIELSYQVFEILQENNCVGEHFKP